MARGTGGEDAVDVKEDGFLSGDLLLGLVRGGFDKEVVDLGEGLLEPLAVDGGDVVLAAECFHLMDALPDGFLVHCLGFVQTSGYGWLTCALSVQVAVV